MKAFIQPDNFFARKNLTWTVTDLRPLKHYVVLVILMGNKCKTSNYNKLKIQ